MADDPADLSKLHDIVVPDTVAWWPPAPGWQILLGIAVLTSVFFSIRRYRRWRANAYRRAALRALAHTNSATEVASVLRRTALAIAPREVIAGLHNKAWIDWLSTRSPKPISANIKTMFCEAIYDSRSKDDSHSELYAFADYWIRNHRRIC